MTQARECCTDMVSVVTKSFDSVWNASLHWFYISLRECNTCANENGKCGTPTLVCGVLRQAALNACLMEFQRLAISFDRDRKKESTDPKEQNHTKPAITLRMSSKVLRSMMALNLSQVAASSTLVGQH